MFCEPSDRERPRAPSRDEHSSSDRIASVTDGSPSYRNSRQAHHGSYHTDSESGHDPSGFGRSRPTMV
ncbi:hypothetical protein D8S78_18225 [Natrialba swarupiae]|nr:hypothetical protein [Natrialba swarupiae]